MKMGSFFSKIPYFLLKTKTFNINRDKRFIWTHGRSEAMADGASVAKMEEYDLNRDVYSEANEMLDYGMLHLSTYDLLLFQFTFCVMSMRIMIIAFAIFKDLLREG